MPPGIEAWTVAQLLRIGDLHACAENHADALLHYARALEEFGASGRDDDEGSEICLRMADAFLARGDTQLAASAIADATRLAGPAPSAMLRARIAGFRGILLASTGNYDEAQQELVEALSLLDADPDTTSSFAARLHLAHGQALERRAMTAKAAASFERALVLFRAVGDERGMAHATNNLALHHKQGHRFKEAIALLEEALAILDRAGDYGRKAPTYLNLGIVHTRLGNWADARKCLERSVQISRELHHHGRLVKALLGLGVLEMHCRRFPEASAAIEEADELARASAYRRERVLAREFRGELYLSIGDAVCARTELEAALHDAETFAPDSDLTVEIRRRLADALFAAGDVPAALHAAEEALALARRLGDHTEAAASLRIVGLSRLLLDRDEEAAPLLDEAFSTFRQVGARHQEALTHLALGRTLLTRDSRNPLNAPRADAHLAAARSMFETLGLAGLQAEAYLLSVEACIARGALEEADALLRRAARNVVDADEERLHERLLAARAELDRRKHLAGEKPIGIGAAGIDRAAHAMLTTALRATHSDRALIARGPAADALEVVAFQGSTAFDTHRLIESARDAVTVALDGASPIVARAARDVAFAVVALGAPGAPWGVLYVDRAAASGKTGAYRASDLRILSALSELGWSSIDSLLPKETNGAAALLPGAAWLQRLPRPVVYQSAAMSEIMATIAKVAVSPACVFVRGETGTGKGVLARAVHELSSRRASPFVQINCAAVPETLLESELFGHVAGAFTGAVRTKRGLLEEAEGGTVFLDEVDKTSRLFQSKLLHVLDRREIRAVGSNQWRRVDVRIVTASNADVHALMQRGEFLEDLYYRLNDISITIPPLRERPDDLDALLRHFLGVCSREAGRAVPVVSDEVRALLVAHTWPGNVREVENLARRFVALVDGGAVIAPAHLPIEMRARQQDGAQETSTLRGAVERLERRLIGEGLSACGGNKSELARRLRISYPTLLAKIRAYQID